MKILFDNPTKRPWKVHRMHLPENREMHRSAPLYYDRPLGQYYIEWVRPNFIFDARLSLVEIVHGAHSTWISLRDMDDEAEFNMRCTDFNVLLRLSKAQPTQFIFNGTIIQGQFSFNTIGGSLKIYPYTA